MPRWNRKLLNVIERKEMMQHKKLSTQTFNTSHNLIEMEVDIKIFRNNINVVRNYIEKNTRIILTAKSNVYSLGREMISYSEDIVDGIAVESFESALAYVQLGFQKDIYILSPFLPQNVSVLPCLNELRNIITCLDSIPLARQIAALCEKRKYKIRVAIKIDSGLNRFGIKPIQLDEMMKILSNTPVEVDSIYTHFPGTTDSPIEKLKKKENQFLKLVASYEDSGIKFHIADSACIIRNIGTKLNLVRTGLLPIGIDPVEVKHQRINGLNLCFKVFSTILRISDVKKGQQLGYRYVVSSDKRVATIAGGYAHGLPYIALFKSYALINGTRCSYVGKPFMEYSIIDISSCNFSVKVGDQVEILSEGCHPSKLAANTQTIPEIFFTSLSKSIRRNYIASLNSAKLREI
jgi:alanine racemase